MTHAALVLGASIDGYAVEGGYDVDGGPQTSFVAAQSLGHVRSSLRSSGTYAHLEDLVGLAASLGCAELRLTMEWARLERRPGERDEGALARYERVVQLAARESMSVAVVLCDAAWPSWVGQEPWLSAWAPGRFGDHAGWVASRLDGQVRAIVTFRAPNAAVRAGWVGGTRPPFRRNATKDAASALDGMLVAHQRAVEAVALASPSTTSAILFEASASYDGECAWRDRAIGSIDPADLDARREEWDRSVARTVGRRRRGAAHSSGRETASLRSSPGWSSLPAFEWWLASDDPDLLGAALDHAAGGIRTVELGAGRYGWDAQLAVGLPAVAQRTFAPATVHLCGLASSIGPLDGPVGLVEIDQRDGGWTATDRGGRVARRLGVARS